MEGQYSSLRPFCAMAGGTALATAPICCDWSPQLLFKYIVLNHTCFYNILPILSVSVLSLHNPQCQKTL